MGRDIQEDRGNAVFQSGRGLAGRWQTPLEVKKLSNCWVIANCLAFRDQNEGLGLHPKRYHVKF
jgi:hypothetical protein